MSERGYRDAIGAAVERLETLREENAQLRAELDRLDAPKRRSARARSAGALVVLSGALFAMAVGAFSHGFACPHRAQRTPHSLDVRTLDVRTQTKTAPEFTDVRDADDCSIPYFYDRNNVKRSKASCLVDRLE
jgi:hypothetical protein